jgi:CRP-like cAMP-binding protein
MILDNVTSVVPLEKDEANLLLSVLKPKAFKKKEFVLRAGDVCRYETFVTKGCLRIFYTDPQGEEHNVKFALENWWALDLESFAMQTPAFYTVQAMEDVDCFQISKQDHEMLYERIPRLEKFARLRFQNAYMLLQHRITQNLFLSAEEKYDAFSKKYPGLELRIPQREIASYLGITPEFLSMLRRKKAKVVIS